MFEITYNGDTVFDTFKDCGKVYENGVYDFTFEERFIIYHVDFKTQVRYVALDIKTGLSSLVLNKKKGNYYNNASYVLLIPDILYSIKYTGDKRYLDKYSDKPLELIDSIFRIILVNSGYKVREEQIELSKKMYIGLTQKNVSICEAEVGTGKTLAYLVAALVAKNHNDKVYSLNLPITITTSSIELQKSIVEKDIPNLSKILMEYAVIDKPLTAIIRKGREHYLCLRRLEDYTKNISRYENKYSNILSALEIFRKNSVIDLDKVKLPGYVKSRISVNASCNNCKLKSRCGYYKYISQMHRMKKLDFQVTNHNMFLMSQKTRKKEVRTMLLESAFVIVDEAHKLRETAEVVFGERLEEYDIQKYVNDIKFLCAVKQDKKKYMETLKTLSDASKELFNFLKNEYMNNDIEEEKTLLLTKELQSRICKIIELLERTENLKTKEQNSAFDGGICLKNILKQLIKTKNTVLWIEVLENNEIALCSTPLNAEELLFEKLWNDGSSYILTSGTLSDGSNFDYYKQSVGLTNVQSGLLLETRTESPFNYETNSRLYVPDNMPLPNENSKEYIEAISQEILKLIKATKGHTAILFTSYKMLNIVYDRTKEDLKCYDVICMTRNNKSAVTDFKKSKNGVLFASGSMWEGVDCIGDCLSSVIIVKLPFPMHNVISELRKKECGDIRVFINEYCMPNMLVKLRQGVGRLIRSENDTGVVSILDPRVNSKSYYTKISHVMKKYPKINKIEEVEQFIDSVKSEEYKEGGMFK